jgi:hypothetical protein
MKSENRKLFRFLLVLIISLLLLAACSTKTTEPTNPPVQQPNQPTVTADPKMGMVVGVLKLKGKPVPFVALGLADVLKDAQGLEVATSYDRSSAPQVDTEADGSFAFMNVKPGRYGLIYANEPETYLLLKPGDPDIQEAVLVTVTAGQKIDLGVLDFNDLPGN